MSRNLRLLSRRFLAAAVLGVLGASPALAQGQARLVLDIDGPGRSSNPRLLTAFGSKVAFVVESPFQTELWTSDGAFETRAFAGYPSGQTVTELKAWGDGLYFVVNQGFNGYLLFKSGGAIFPFPQEVFRTNCCDPLPITQLTPAGPFLYFVVKDQFQFTLFRTNGTDDLSALDPLPVLSFMEEPRLLADLNGRLLLSGRTFMDTTPFLWTSDGTAQGTVRIQMPFGGPTPAVDAVTVLGDRAFFVASDAQRGRELWSTTTELVAPLFSEVRPGPASSDPRELTVVQGRLFFTADDGIHGRELWTLDESGPVPAFELVSDIVPGPQDAAPQFLRAAESRLYFTADDGVFGRELWVTEARPVPFGQERTRRVTDEDFGPGSSTPQALTNAEGVLFFRALGGIPPVQSEELYTTGGTSQTTFRFDLSPFSTQASSPADFTVAGGHVFFTADDGTSGRELWTMENRPPTVQVPPDHTVEVGDFPFLQAFIQDPDSPGSTSEWRDADGALLSREFFAFSQVNAPGVYEYTAVARDSAGGRGENRVRVNTPGRTAPVVSILSPAAGDVLHAGAAYDVLWTASDPEAIAGARVLVSTDNGTFYAPITGCEVQGAVSTCRWTPPSAVEKVRLRVEVTDEMGDRGFAYAELRVTGPLTEPQRLDVTLVGVDGAWGGIRAGDFDLCGLNPGQPTVTCTFFYPPGSVQPLQAGWPPDSVFVGWSGACTGTGDCSVPMNGPKQVTATFAPRRAVLTVIVQSVSHGNGYIGVVGPPNTPPGFCEAVVDGTQTCTFPYAVGAQVVLGATTANGSHFAGYGFPCGPQPECFLNVNQDMEITATFGGASQLSITVSSFDGGVGVIRGTTSDGQFLICPPGPGDPPQTCTFDVAGGVSVQLEALSEGETGFIGWTGGPCAGTDPFCSFTMGENTAVTGAFQGGVRKQLDVITASSDNARGQVALSDGNFCPVIPSNVPNTQGCTIFYNPGTVLSMTAQPDPGTVFLGWSGACTGTGACTVTMDQARQVTGTFRGPSRRLTLQVGSVGGGRGGVRNSVNNALCQTTGSPVVCVVTVPQVGTVVTLTAVPQAGSRLLAWSGACSGAGACQVTMSDAVTVGATFGPPNRPPLANAGGPYTGVRDTPVTFNGAGSSDPDGDALTYAWDFGDGTQGTGVAPTHAYGTTGTFTATLVVSDGQASSAPATATVTIANRPPVAGAGGPYSGVRGVPVTFDGSGSSDPDGDALTYAWDFGDGSTGTGVAPSHAYGTTGTFTATLVVSDGQAASAPATATVTISNAPPQANAGPDQTVRRLTVVVLDGRTSSDSDGTLTAFAWRQVSGPSVALISPNTPRTAFVAPLVLFNPVVLEFELKVTDNNGATATDRVRVTVTR